MPMLVLGALAGAVTGVMAGSNISAPGTYKRKIDVASAGGSRSYRLHVPRAYDGETPLPVVVFIHGAFSNAKTAERRTGFSDLADQEDFIVIYPQGIGLMGMLRHWNSGNCCGKALKKGLDDVGFVMSAVNDVASSLRIDRTRLYVTGFSNGGMLAHRVAAEKADAIAAAATVAATIGGQPKKDQPEWTVPPPSAPVPILMIHGTADEHVPYEGGQGPKSPGDPIPLSTDRSVEFWVGQNGCQTDSSSSSGWDGRVLKEKWSRCRAEAEVIFYTLNGWDHRWPGPETIDEAKGDEGLGGFDAARIIWEFFERHHREAAAGGADPLLRSRNTEER